MKNIVFLILFLVSPLLLIAQSKDLPKYYMNGKDTVGIILSMSQLKKIKNDLELKSYLESLSISCDSTLDRLVVVVDEYEKTLKTYRLSLNRLDSANNNNISLLETCLDSKKEEERLRSLCEVQSKMKDTLITNKDKQINTLKIEKAIGWWGSGSLLVTSIILGIILLVH